MYKSFDKVFSKPQVKNTQIFVMSQYLKLPHLISQEALNALSY